MRTMDVPWTKSECRAIARDILKGSSPLLISQKTREVFAGIGSPSWYVVCTAPKMEWRVQSDLIEAGFAVYLPTYRIQRKARGKVTALEWCRRTLFPRYLFAQATEGVTGAICGVDGVVGLLRDLAAGGLPRAVPDGVVSSLLDRQNAGEWDQRLGGPVRKKGAKVRVGSGVLSFEATVIEAVGERVAVEMQMLGSSRVVSVSAANVG